VSLTKRNAVIALVVIATIWLLVAFIRDMVGGDKAEWPLSLALLPRRPVGHCRAQRRRLGRRAGPRLELE